MTTDKSPINPFATLNGVNAFPQTRLVETTFNLAEYLHAT